MEDKDPSVWRVVGFRLDASGKVVPVWVLRHPRGNGY
jgi:hypothetical protein